MLPVAASRAYLASQSLFCDPLEMLQSSWNVVVDDDVVEQARLPNAVMYHQSSLSRGIAVRSAVPGEV